MQSFTTHTGLACPLGLANVDTDQLIPKQFLLATTREGFGRNLFFDWRYKNGQVNPDFILNRPEYAGASVLVAGENFGSGSSREAAVWALADFGIRAVIAPSFGDIFKNNALENGLLTVQLGREEVDFLLENLQKNEDKKITISLLDKGLNYAGRDLNFELDEFRRHCLIQGLDSISLILQHEAAIKKYEASSPDFMVRRG